LGLPPMAIALTLGVDCIGSLNSWHDQKIVRKD
jgi:hypothetical protein